MLNPTENASDAERVVLKNVAILAGPEFEFIARGMIEIQNGRISAIDKKPVGSADHEFDCEGLIAIPGFVDAHTHLGDSVAKEAGVGLPIADVVSKQGSKTYNSVVDH
jgi:imidazolonepropionase-like amidohydrolase